MNQPRRERIIVALKAVFEEVSGLTLDDADFDLSFLEMGLDSLTLTQAAGRLKKKTGVKVTFRQLMDEAPSLGTLAALIDANAPPEAFAAPASAPLPTRSPAALTAGNGPAPPSAAAEGAPPSTGPSPEHAPGPAPWPTPAAGPAMAPPGGTAATPFAAWSTGWPAAGAAAS
ncbi:MAG: acyl carrier protein, partial [Myxococcota bacterium]